MPPILILGSIFLVAERRETGLVITFDVATMTNLAVPSYEDLFQSNIMRFLPSFTDILLKESDEDHIPCLALQKMYSEWLTCRNVGMRYGSNRYPYPYKTIFFKIYVSTLALVRIDVMYLCKHAPFAFVL